MRNDIILLLILLKHYTMKRTWKEKLEDAWSLYKLNREACNLAWQRIFDGLPKGYKKLSKMMNVCFLLFGVSAILFLYKEWFSILWIEICLLLIMIVVAFLMYRKALLVYDEKFRKPLLKITKMQIFQPCFLLLSGVVLWMPLSIFIILFFIGIIGFLVVSIIKFYYQITLDQMVYRQIKAWYRELGQE